MTSTTDAITATRNWIKSVVIDCNFCPFAARVYNNQRIRYTLGGKLPVTELLSLLATELAWLDADPTTETAFLILPEGFADFGDYLGLVKQAERWLRKSGYEGTYQIASFHPDYCFQGAENDDPANYTNRSPYPMLHILREEGLEQALRFFKHPERIPENNVAFAREKGLAYMQMLLASCV